VKKVSMDSVVDSSLAGSSFSEEVGRPLISGSEMYVLNLLERADEMFFIEQELNEDAALCAIGQKVACAIIEGADVADAVAKAKVVAWKPGGLAAGNFKTRYEARENEDFKCELLEDREGPSSRLIQWLDRVQRAPDEVHEATMMRDAMFACLSQMSQDKTELGEATKKLTRLFYELQNVLQELLRGRQDSLLPQMNKVWDLTLRRTAEADHTVCASARRWSAKIVRAGGLLMGSSVLESVANQEQGKRLSDALVKDKVLCDKVRNLFRHLDQLVDHVDNLRPLSDGAIPEETLSTPLLHGSFFQPLVRTLPGVSFVTNFMDSACPLLTQASCIELVEAETDYIRSLLEMVITRADFWQNHLATTRATHQVAKSTSVTHEQTEAPFAALKSAKVEIVP